MFDKILASLKVEDIAVDTILKKEEVKLGETLKGKVHLKGGEKDEKISSIELYLWAFVEGNDGAKKEVLSKFVLSESFVLKAKSEKSFSFEKEVPIFLPISTEFQEIFLATSIEINGKVYSKDTDSVSVLPAVTIENVLGQIEELGFDHTTESGNVTKNNLGVFVQHFEFVPNALYSNRVEFLTIDIVYKKDKLEVLFIVNTKPYSLNSFREEENNTDKKEIKVEFERGKKLNKGFVKEKIEEVLK